MTCFLFFFPRPILVSMDKRKTDVTKTVRMNGWWWWSCLYVLSGNSIFLLWIVVCAQRALPRRRGGVPNVLVLLFSWVLVGLDKFERTSKILSWTVIVAGMTRMKPEPAEIEFKGMRFLITDRPTDSTIDKYIEVSSFGIMIIFS